MKIMAHFCFFSPAVKSFLCQISKCTKSQLFIVKPRSFRMMMMTDLRSSDLTEYPEPDSPDPCLGSVYIWRPFIPPSQGSAPQLLRMVICPQISVFQCSWFSKFFSSERSLANDLYVRFHLLFWMLEWAISSPFYKCGHIVVNMEQSVVQAQQPSAQHGWVAGAVLAR